METKITCPLGSECERINGDHIERCAWFIELEGKHPQTGKEIRESKCAMAWQPLLIIEGNAESRGASAAIQSLRNETIKRQEKALEVVREKIASDQ
jgi:hypothetical protein